MRAPLGRSAGNGLPDIESFVTLSVSATTDGRDGSIRAPVVERRDEAGPLGPASPFGSGPGLVDGFAVAGAAFALAGAVAPRGRAASRLTQKETGPLGTGRSRASGEEVLL